VPDALLAPFGGGGLATGLAWALAHEEDRDAPPRRVWGVQSEASPAMALSLQDDRACVELAGDPTLAEGLEGGISPEAFDRARAAIAGVLVVREARIGAAMVHAERDLGLVLEGSAAIALVPAMHGLPPALRGGDVVCVLTGRNVDASRLDNLRGRY
jgi:threonine dehydratase